MPDQDPQLSTKAQKLYFEDIKQQQLEEALQESERRFRATFEQAAVGIAHVSIDGHWLLVNKKLCHIIGYTYEELLARTFQDITHPDDLEADLAFVKRLLANELQTYSMEKRYFRKNGTVVWINLTVSLVRETTGMPLYFISVVEDISERKRVEEERAQLLAHEVETRTTLQALNRLQDSFIAIISHEFRTTLTGILGFSGLLYEQTFDPEEVKEFAADIRADAQRLNRMIDDVLDLERMKSGQMTLTPGLVDLNRTIHTSVDHMRPTTPLHTFRLELSESLPLISADNDKLLQVLANLLSNAIKYSPLGGEIAVCSFLEGDFVHVCICDQGIGMPAEALELIFTPYSRIGVEETRHIKGTGLGLSIVRQIIQMHHGQIWATSIHAHGSQFHFILPITQSQRRIASTEY